MNIIRSHGLNKLFNDFDLAFDQNFFDFFDNKRSRNQNGLVNLSENEESYVFSIELPGFDKESIHLAVNNNRLEIKAERKIEYQKDEQVHLNERKTMNTYRTVRLPEKADSEKVDARYQDGVLIVELAKNAKAKQKRITVS